MDQESELIQKVNSLEQKIEKNQRQLLIAVSAFAAGILTAAIALASGSSVRGAALGCMVAGVVTALLGPQLKAFKK